MKRGQISTEYLVIVGFITFVVISILGIALVYTSSIKNSIKVNQNAQFSDKLSSSSESRVFAREPSKIEITGYIPEGVTNIQILEKEIVITFTTNSGENIRSFTSRVSLEGNITSNSGVKVLQLVAKENKVVIS